MASLFHHISGICVASWRKFATSKACSLTSRAGRPDDHARYTSTPLSRSGSISLMSNSPLITAISHIGIISLVPI